MQQENSDRLRRPAPPETAPDITPAAPAEVSNDDARLHRRHLRKRRLRPVLLLLGPLLAILGGTYVYLTGGRFVSTENAYVKSDKVMISAQVSGLISAVPVAENQHVDKGAVLFRIDDSNYRIALDEADARLQTVRENIAALQAEYRQKQQEMALARTNARYAKTEFDRQARLVATHVTSRKNYDDARHTLDVARQNIGVIEQQEQQILAQLGGKPDLPVEQRPAFQAAMAARDRAALDLKRTVVRAPFSGYANHTPEVGQQVVGNSPLATPVMSIVADTGLWIEANYKETDLTHVRPGQPVTIAVDTYPDQEWHGRVVSISPATGAEFSVIPPQNATGNWVKVVQRIPVRVSVDNGHGGPVLRAGMSTTVDIDTGHVRAMPAFVRTALSWIDAMPPARAEESETLGVTHGGGAAGAK